jgi:hypothetical protein
MTLFINYLKKENEKGVEVRRPLLAIFVFFLTAQLFCQVVQQNPGSADNDFFLQPKKFNYHVTLGSQFTSVSGYGSGLNTYITPSFTYNLNKRFTIGGGVSIIQTNYFKSRSYFQNEQTAGSNGNFTSAMIFIDGQYIVNKRLTLSGSAFKQFPISQNPLPYNPFNPVSSKGAQGINFNVGYQLGEHVFIQAGFRYSEGINPYYNDPFSRNLFMNNTFGAPSGVGVSGW